MRSGWGGVLTILVVFGAAAQEISISPLAAPPGASLPVPVRFSSEQSSIAGVQFDLEFDPAVLTFSVVPGQGMRDAGKSLYQANRAANLRRFLIVGLNNTAIGSSDLLNLFVEIRANAARGSYRLRFSNVAAVDPDGGEVRLRSVDAALTVDPNAGVPNQITSAGVVSAASYLPGPVTPGQAVVIYGAGIGPAELVSLRLKTPTLIDTTLARTAVLFDGIAAPLLYAQANVVAAIAPYGMAGKASTQLRINYLGKDTNTVSLPVADTAPALFSADSTGSGPGAILNQDYTLNTSSNRATRGSVVMLYATGEGMVAPAVPDGTVIQSVLPKPVADVGVKIGGIDAQVTYAGAAPGMVVGIMQVNVRIPDDAEIGAAVAVLLTVGGVQSPAGVTIALR
ncbi:MAG: hypothetical protein HYR60_03530 [Acidobacteria bacterium]|nr:hypothetical protein [Acidobacteriota bacterium]